MNKLPRKILWLVSALLVGSYIVGPLMDPDLWWHTVIGRWILTHREVPWVDYWTVEGSGKPWLAYSWLFELLAAVSEKHWGTNGLVFGQFFAICLLSVICCFVSASISKNWHIGLLFGSFGVLCTINSVSLRPQLFSWVLFATTILLADLIARGGLKKSYLSSLVLAFILWANIHFSPVLGIFAIFTWLIGSVDLEIWMPNKRSLTVAVGISILCILATFITPYAGREWGVMLETTSHPMLFEQVVEFSPATILRESSAVFLLFFLLLGFLLHEAPRSIELPKVFGLVVLVIMGLSVVKFFPYAAIYLMCLVSLIWRRGSERTYGLGRLGEGLSLLVAQLSRFPTWLATLVVVSAIISNVSKLIDKPLAENRFAGAEMDYFLKNNLSFPILNTFSDGGYVLYRVSNESGEPSHPVAIDGRTNLITTDLWVDYEEAAQGRENWRKLLDRIGPNTIIWRKTSPFVTLLKESGQWCEVDLSPSVEADRNYSLLTKKGTEGCPLRK